MDKIDPLCQLAGNIYIYIYIYTYIYYRLIGRVVLPMLQKTQVQIEVKLYQRLIKW